MVILENWIETVEIDVQSSHYKWNLQNIQKILQTYNILSIIITPSNTCIVEYDINKDLDILEILEKLYTSISIPMSAWKILPNNFIQLFEYPV
jgi:hypothetical protein